MFLFSLRCICMLLLAVCVMLIRNNVILRDLDPYMSTQPFAIVLTLRVYSNAKTFELIGYSLRKPLKVNRAMADGVGLLHLFWWSLFYHQLSKMDIDIVISGYYITSKNYIHFISLRIYYISIKVCQFVRRFLLS